MPTESSTKAAAFARGFALALSDIPREEEIIDEQEFTDTHCLEEVAAGWTDDQFAQWIMDGVAKLNDKSAHLAFTPIRLYPIGNYIEQLACVIDLGTQAHFKQIARVPAILTAILDKDRETPVFANEQIREQTHKLSEAIKLELMRPRLRQDQLPAAYRND